jgi:hypothetical protein
MQTSDQRLQQLFDLNMQLHAIDGSISYLREILEQLSKDPCAVTVRFDMHNHEQHEINKAAHEKARAEYENSRLAVLDAVSGFQRGIKVNVPECRNQLLFSATEPTAMRIINALLQEKLELRAKLMSSIEKLVVHTMRIEITPIADDPIRTLHVPPHQ